MFIFPRSLLERLRIENPGKWNVRLNLSLINVGKGIQLRLRKLLVLSACLCLLGDVFQKRRPRPIKRLQIGTHFLLNQPPDISLQGLIAMNS